MGVRDLTYGVACSWDVWLFMGEGGIKWLSWIQ